MPETKEPTQRAKQEELRTLKYRIQLGQSIERSSTGRNMPGHVPKQRRTVTMVVQAQRQRRCFQLTSRVRSSCASDSVEQGNWKPLNSRTVEKDMVKDHQSRYASFQPIESSCLLLIYALCSLASQEEIKSGGFYSIFHGSRHMHSF